MTKTIELKTIRTAEEPDRTRKYTNGKVERIYGGVPVQYDEDRQGWTWGSMMSAYSWGDFVEQYPGMFPLEEMPEPKLEHRLTGYGELRLTTETPGSAGKNVSFATYDGLQDFTLHFNGFDMGYIDFTPEQAAQLRDFLVENVITEEVQA